MSSLFVYPRCFFSLLLKIAVVLTAVFNPLSIQGQSPKDVVLKAIKENNFAELQRILRQKPEGDDVLIIKGFFSVNGDSAAGYYEDLVNNYPQSPYALFAQERMNEYNFANDFVYSPAIRLPENIQPQASRPNSELAASNSTTPVSANPSVPASSAQTSMISPVGKPEPNSPLPKSTDPPKVMPKSDIFPEGAQKVVRFRLQFGSFREKKGAERFAELMKNYDVKIVQELDSKNSILYKVKSNKTYSSRDEAKVAGFAIPFQSFVVSGE